MRFVILFLFFVSSLFAEEKSPQESFAEMLGSHDTIVGGKVNAITGSLVLDRVDLELPGVVDFPILQTNGGSNFDTYLRRVTFDKHKFNVGYCLGCGIDFHMAGKINRTEYPVNSEFVRVEYQLEGDYSKKNGLTNGFQDFPNGKTNLKNVQFFTDYDKNIKSGKSTGYPYVLTLGNGETRIYEHKYYLDHRHLPIEIRKPNGHRVFFSFDDKKLIEQIRITNEDDTVELGSYKFRRSQDKLMSRCPFKEYLEIESNDGRIIKKTSVSQTGALKCLIIDRPNDIQIKCNYDYPGRLVSVHYPENRRFEIYYQTGSKEDENPAIGRIKSIQEPVGPNNSMRVTHSFEYDCLCDYITQTTATDALGRDTKYAYDIYGVLKTKKIFIGQAGYWYKGWVNEAPELCYEYTWGEEGNDRGSLLCKLLKDRMGNCIASTNYAYDDRGNVLTHTISGNLTGEGDSSFSKTYTYSDDGFNLMLSESDGKSTTHMAYRPKTNLLIKKWVEVEGNIIQREFHTYDANATLVETILDDGCGETVDDLTSVTERHITRITPKKETPGIGLPEVIEEFYLEDGVEKLLKKSVAQFTREGWKEREEIYDAEGALAYTLYWIYNSYGQPVEWNDALNHIYKKVYDANGNCLEEWGPRHDCYTSYTYDHANRCREKAFHTAEGAVLVEKYDYDLCSNRTSLTDHTGAVTRFAYDYRNRLHKTTNSLNETTELHYDGLDHLTCSKDAQGNKTCIGQTAYGKPFHIHYPDGSFEEMTYSPDGFLVEKINKNGSLTKKHYDALNREILEELYSPQGEFFSSSSKIYNTFHLLSETDGEGYTTYYIYDKAGRKIEERRGSSVTEYTYDSLGRIHKEKEWDGNVWVIKSFTYDLLNRVLSETIEGYSQKSFAYNETGQVIQETTLGTTHLQYDSLNRLIKKTDPLGHVEYHIHDDFKRIYCHIDALGLETITYRDALQRPIKIEKKSREGALLSTSLTTYDKVGNVITQEIILPDRSTTNRWEYDTLKRPIKEIKGAGTKEETITSTTYTHAGQKETVTKPDGVVITYTYTPAGDLETLTSSDGSVAYAISYNKIGQIIEAKDLLTGLSTLRTYDEDDNLSSEHLENGLSLSFTYDPLHRTRSLHLPDSTIEWEYQGPYLSSASKGNTTVSFTRYNQAGHLLEMQFPIGPITYERDLLGRATLVQTPVGPLSLHYDSMGNLLHKEWKGKSTDYTYDPLYQLLSETGHLYQYDNLYNRTEKDHEKTAYNALNQSTSLSYDLNGNLLELNGHTFCYDALDRLISTDDTTYTYDFFNRRLSKNNDRYLYHGQNEIGCPDKQELRLLANGRGAEIGASVLLELQGRSYFPLHDEQGSIITLLTSNATIAEDLHYTAFGEENPTHPLSPWRFSSKRLDPESSLLYFGRRYYSPTLGRWTTSDPAGYSDGPNLYAYVHNNPLTHFDLYGLTDSDYNTHDHSDHNDKEQKDFNHLKDFEDDMKKITKNFRDTDRTILNTAKDFIKDNPRLSSALGLGDNHDHLTLCAMPSTRNIAVIAATAIKAGTSLAKSTSRTIHVNPILKSTNQMEKTAEVSKAIRITDIVKRTTRKERLAPHKEASGAHSTFRRDMNTEKITHYETYQPQTNVRNPNPWESVKRFDGPAGIEDRHYNKVIRDYIETPHVHDPKAPGGIRYPEAWELPY